MAISKTTVATVLLVTAVTAGCGKNANPAAPTGVPDQAASSSPGLSSASLSVSKFSLTGWYAGDRFHYVPTVAVVETTRLADASIQSVLFKWTDTGETATIIKFGKLLAVSGGGSLTVVQDGGAGYGPIVELTSATAPASLTVIVTFVDDAGHAGEATAAIPVPAVPISAAAGLTLSSFTVDGWYVAPRFHYWPKLRLTSTGGAIAIKKIAFELLNVGATGRVPPSWQSFSVPAGGTLDLASGPYDDPWLEIDSTADAAQVSVVIVFIDQAGRGGEITAVAPVVRR